MAVEHLEDQQFQMYLDKTLHVNMAGFEAHLEYCQDCRQKLAEYKEIYQVLEEDSLPKLATNFSQSVMNRLQIKPKYSFLYNEYLIGSVTIFTAILVLMLIMKPWNTLSRIFQSILDQGSMILTSLAPMLGGKGSLVIGICIILIVIEILDYKFLRPRLRQFR